jgi:MFS family permease
MSNPSNIRLVYVARGIRGFGDGFATIILPAYLDALSYDPVQIGIVLTVSLLGTAVFTLAIGWIAPRHDLRTLLLGCTALMVFTGFAFPNFQHIAVIVIVTFVGTINPSTGDLGILVPLEHAMLARGVADQERTHAFSRYSMIGALSMAVGTLAAAFPDVLTHQGVGRIDAFRLMFYAYGVLGLACVALYRQLPHVRMAEPSHRAPLGPSRHIVYRLAALFSLDAFAGGFVVQSLLVLWLFERFDLSVSAASVFFFWAGILSASSYPVAARLAAHFGLVNTMVFTHIPSNLFLILAAYSSNLYVTLGLLLLRSALSQMDVPTRTSYVMAVVTPPERATAASVTAVPRSLASAISPTFAGLLLTTAFPSLPLIVCGSLKILYDFALLYSFHHLKPPEERVRSAAAK